jgi:hypothetical protein
MCGLVDRYPGVHCPSVCRVQTGHPFRGEEESRGAEGIAALNKGMSQLGGGGIPKHIHQIWLGRAPKPDSWIESVRAFAKSHGYKYTLWTEAKAEKELDWDAFPGLRREYARSRGELAARADIIRLLVLYKYGGIYIDADSVVLKSAKFAKFLEENRHSMFFAWENLSAARTRKLGDLGPGLRGARRLVANGVIGAQAGHPFLKRLLGGLVANANALEGEAAWKRVGPLYVSRVYAQSKGEHPDVHVYPMRYFYPRHWKGITDPELHTKVTIPGESMLFQYGYTTNKFDKIFAERARARRGTRRNR